MRKCGGQLAKAQTDGRPCGQSVDENHRAGRGTRLRCGEKVAGRKGFIAVDTLGLLWALLVVPADTEDRVGGIALMEKLRAAVQRLKKVWGDSQLDTALREAGCRWG